MTYLGPLSDSLGRLKIDLLLRRENRWPGSRACVIEELEETGYKLAVRHELTECEGM